MTFPKHDIVYKLGEGSKHNNLELRYSLRSLVNYPFTGQVYVVGYKPEWIKNVIHIPAQDPYTYRKDANLIQKLLLVCYQKNLTEYFLNISDDQIFLRPSDNELRHPFNDDISVASFINIQSNRWQVRLLHTFERLREKSLPTHNYEAHVPCLLNKTLFPQILLRYDWGEGKGMCGNTLYFNTLDIEKEKPSQSARENAAKIFSPVLEGETVERICFNKDYLCFNDRSFNKDLILYLDQKFPEKSIYEK